MSLAERFSRGLVDKSLNSCTRWAEHKVHMPNPFPGLINFDRFPWQREVLDIDEGSVTVQKAAQMGFSIAGLIRSLYCTVEQQRDVLYVLPTQGLAGDFSKARFDALIETSPELVDEFKNVNSVGLKVTRKRANLYIRGSVSSRGLVSVPVSSAVIDEFDRCADNTLDLVMERLSGQLKKYMFSLSTPTLPEWGISKQYDAGTKEKFYFKCPSCGKRETLRWPDNAIIAGDFPGDPRCKESAYICSQCKAVLPHETKMDWMKGAIWVPERPNVQGHRSFHINQMFSTTVTPGEMASAHHKAQLSDLSAIEFKNQKLGEPHLAEGSRLTDGLIAKCKTAALIGSDRPQFSGRKIYMGVDVGSFLDCWIAEYRFIREPGKFPYENSRAKLLQTTRIPADSWHQLENMMREWQVLFAVIDSSPDTVNARRFCKKFHGFAAMSQYRQGTVASEIKEVLDEQLVPTLTVDRTTFLDLSLGRFHHGMIEIPGNTPGVVTEHLKAPARTYEFDQLGLPKAVYKSLADDHFAHAGSYCEQAFLKDYSRVSGRTITPGENL